MKIYKIFKALIYIIWILDILNMPFMAFMDTTIPINDLAWLLILVFLPAEEN